MPNTKFDIDLESFILEELAEYLTEQGHEHRGLTYRKGLNELFVHTESELTDGQEAQIQDSIDEFLPHPTWRADKDQEILEDASIEAFTDPDSNQLVTVGVLQRTLEAFAKIQYLENVELRKPEPAPPKEISVVVEEAADVIRNKKQDRKDKIPPRPKREKKASPPPEEEEDSPPEIEEEVPQPEEEAPPPPPEDEPPGKGKGKGKK